jgi:hypothetical protein
MAKKKSFWQKAKELANPEKTWAERETGRDKAIKRRLKRELSGNGSAKRKKKHPKRYGV